MLDRLTQPLDFHGAALLLRAERMRLLASNIANADTPNYKARDFDFRAALSQATGVQGGSAMIAAAGDATRDLPATKTNDAHLPAVGGGGFAPTMQYRTSLQTALDANTVDLDVERANFAENTVRYEAGLRFINGQIRTMLTAINGQ